MTRHTKKHTIFWITAATLLALIVFGLTRPIMLDLIYSYEIQAINESKLLKPVAKLLLGHIPPMTKDTKIFKMNPIFLAIAVYSNERRIDPSKKDELGWMIERFVERGVDINEVNELGTTELMSAVIREDPVLTQVLIENKADINVKKEKSLDEKEASPINGLTALQLVQYMKKNNKVKDMNSLLQVEKILQSAGN